MENTSGMVDKRFCYIEWMKDCSFCIENNLLKVPIIHDSQLWYLVDMYDFEGSNAVLAITKRHVATPFDIDSKEWSALHELLPVFKSLVDAREEPQGYSLGWNVSDTGGQTVPHAHLHIAARYDDEELAGRGIRYHFKPERNKRKSSL